MSLQEDLIDAVYDVKSIDSTISKTRSEIDSCHRTMAQMQGKIKADPQQAARNAKLDYNNIARSLAKLEQRLKNALQQKVVAEKEVASIRQKLRDVN